MTDLLVLTVREAQEMAKIGHSLASNLYDTNTDILLDGPLGAGKTTFVQGFLSGMGVRDTATSPTYALQQEYHGKNGRPLLHIDLHRLTEKQALELLQQSAEENVIRCIEWASRAGSLPGRPQIRITIGETNSSDRLVSFSFRDAPIPSEVEITNWRNEALLQPHIRAHCDQVARVGRMLSAFLIGQNRIVRSGLLDASCRVHDLLRFLDFRGRGAPDGVTDSAAEKGRWEEWRERFPSLHHEAACASFLRQQGYDACARIVETHGVTVPPTADSTIEQMLLYYSDKRCIGDRVVTVEERYADFEARYGSERRAEMKIWKDKTLEIEHLLFPDGVPPLS